MVLTHYDLTSEKITKPVRMVMLSDSHNVTYDKIIQMTQESHPDVIFIVGDLVDRHRKTYDRALPFVNACAHIAPVFFSYGNHEVKFPVLTRQELSDAGATVLDNSWARFGELTIAGHTPYTDSDWVSDFEQVPGYRILLTHMPQYVFNEVRHLEDRDIDLFLAGHVHGGQWRLPNGYGVLAPGQGLYAKYVRGQYGKLIIGAGLANTAGPLIPRIHNPTEVVEIDLRPSS